MILIAPLADCNQAIRLDPTERHAYSNRGWAYNDTREYARAIEDLTEAIRLDPGSVVAFNNRGLD